MSDGILNSRFNLSSLLGVMFGGKRKLYDVFGYDKTIKYDDVLAKYSRQDIAGRIVSAYADALWGNPPEITSTDPKWNTAWEKLVKELSLYQAVSRVDKMAAMGKYATLLIGFENVNPLCSSVFVLFVYCAMRL